MTAALRNQLAELSVAEKLNVIAFVTEAIDSEINTHALPEWHGEELASRRRDIQDGKGGFLPLDKAWAEIDAQIHDHRSRQARP
jgi:post-segregation antitoxin (ccd killing protein)